MSVSTANLITLKGSTDIVTEFFEYSVNSILYQRAIYPPESFKKVPKYGLPMMLTTDEDLSSYISNIMKQLQEWLMTDKVRKLVLVVKSVDSNDTLERWVFSCENTATAASLANGTDPSQVQSDKCIKEITKEIQSIVRQITASVTFLPLLSEPCYFDLLVYADQEATVPLTWGDSDACLIANADDVRLRSFDTKIHKVDAVVSYRVDED